MSTFDRPYPESQRERRWRGRRPNSRFEADERSSWPPRELGERDEFGSRASPEPREYHERFRDEPGWRERDFAGGDGPEAYGDLGYDEGRYAQRRERGSEQYERFGGWDRPRESREFYRSGDAGYPGAASGGLYGGTPSANRGIRQLGRFAGRGPKGYQRSDERLREEICDRLMADPEIDAAELTVSVSGGEVTLEGSVPERRMKRDAEDCAESISGVRQVHNRLRIEPSEGDERSGSASAASGAGRSASAVEGQRSTAGRKTSL